MKIKLIVELESRDDFDAEKWGEAIESAVAGSVPSAVFDDDGEVAVFFDSVSVELAK